MEEEWKQIVGYDNYFISNFGNIKNNNTNIIKKPQQDNKGYYRVQLYKKTGNKNFRIHRLVALYFIENPNNYTEVDHIDENKTNNNVLNLRWCSGSQNCHNRSKKKGDFTSTHKGVHFCKKKNKWIARTMINRKDYWIGAYKTENEAIVAVSNFVESNNLQKFYKQTNKLVKFIEKTFTQKITCPLKCEESTLTSLTI